MSAPVTRCADGPSRLGAENIKVCNMRRVALFQDLSVYPPSVLAHHPGFHAKGRVIDPEVRGVDHPDIACRVLRLCQFLEDRLARSVF